MDHVVKLDVNLKNVELCFALTNEGRMVTDVVPQIAQMKTLSTDYEFTDKLRSFFNYS